MTDSPVHPVVIDGTVSDEKLESLVGLGTEYAELDFKSAIDLNDKKQLLAFVKDVAAMQVRGGYIIAGIDDDGTPSGALDEVDLKPFDEARLVPKLRKWLPAPLKLIPRAAEHEGHKVVIVCIEPHPSGCVFMQKDGTYEENGQEKALFRAGEVFWRDGTRSVRLDQQGFEQIMAKRTETLAADGSRATVFENEPAAHRALRKVIEAHTPKSADLIEYSTATIHDLLEMLRIADTRLRILICNPDSAVNDFQARRIEERIHDLTAVTFRNSHRAEIRMYRLPASIRGRLIDDRYVTVGWHVYSLDDVGVYGHTHTMIGAMCDTPEGRQLRATFMEAFDSLWHAPTTETLLASASRFR